MRRLFAVAISAGAFILAATPAAAGAPVREPVPTPPPFVVDGACPFGVGVQTTLNSEYTISFTDASGNPVKQITTGHLVVILSNVDSGKSLTVNLSGPSIFTANPDGSFTLEFLGPQAGVIGGFFVLGAGRTVFQIAPDDTMTVTQVGHFRDLCALLA